MKKFANAFRGLLVALSHKDVAIQAILAIGTVILGFILNLDIIEWMVVIVCIALVLLAEMVNTCIENLCDIVEPKYDKRIKDIKDLAAGAVLVTAIFAFAVAIIIVLRRL